MVWDRGVLMIWGKTRRTIHKSMSIRICSGLAIFLFVFSDTPLVWRGLEYCLSQTRAYSCPIAHPLLSLHITFIQLVCRQKDTVAVALHYVLRIVSPPYARSYF